MTHYALAVVFKPGRRTSPAFKRMLAKAGGLTHQGWGRVRVSAAAISKHPDVLQVCCTWVHERHEFIAEKGVIR